jgi:hypothetical protein
MEAQNGVVFDAVDNVQMREAMRLYEIECERVERLRQKYAPDQPESRPAAPNTTPEARPGWLMKALESEAKVRDRELAAAEAEQQRRARCDVTRGEFEDLLARLDLPTANIEAVLHARREASRRHYDEINARGRKLGEPPSREEEALRDRQVAESRARDAEKRLKNEERFAAEEAQRVAAWRQANARRRV